MSANALGNDDSFTISLNVLAQMTKLIVSKNDCWLQLYSAEMSLCVYSV